jgi:hypothetical protein
MVRAMGFCETLVVYFVVGAAVAVAVYVADGTRTISRTGFLLATAVLFWPLYVPLLLSARAPMDGSPANAAKAHADEMAVAIGQVERELQAALSSLDGWAENALAGEARRIGELCRALSAQAARIREMDELLLRTKVDHDAAGPTPGGEHQAGNDAAIRWQKSRQARAQNLARLAHVRRRSHADLMATLAWIRELVSMIHLAKFTGAPASRAEELVAQIAAAVEGVSAAAWSEDDCKHEVSPSIGA